MEQATILFKKINELRNIDSGISNILKNEQQYLKDQIQLFNDKQYEINKLDFTKKQGNITLNAQLEDMTLKENSEQMKLFFWGSLAIFSILFTINQMKK